MVGGGNIPHPQRGLLKLRDGAGAVIEHDDIAAVRAEAAQPGLPQEEQPLQDLPAERW